MLLCIITKFLFIQENIFKVLGNSAISLYVPFWSGIPCIKAPYTDLLVVFLDNILCLNLKHKYPRSNHSFPSSCLVSQECNCTHKFPWLPETPEESGIKEKRWFLFTETRGLEPMVSCPHCSQPETRLNTMGTRCDGVEGLTSWWPGNRTRQRRGQGTIHFLQPSHTLPTIHCLPIIHLIRNPLVD